jgi:site-specific recombinase XerD
MSFEIIPRKIDQSLTVPVIIADAGEKSVKRFIEFFTATIRNANTRRAYARAVSDFLTWCHQCGLTLTGIEPVHVAAYIEQLTQSKAAPTVKQHLAAIGMLCDWLTTGGILPFNPAASVRGPKHVVKRGKTPVLTAGEARQLCDDPYSTSPFHCYSQAEPLKSVPIRPARQP